MDEMVFVLPSFLNLVILSLARRQQLSHFTWWTEVIVIHMNPEI